MAESNSGKWWHFSGAIAPVVCCLLRRPTDCNRNTRDAVTLEDLDIEIFFIKEGEVLSKNAKSQVKFMHDIRLAMARNYFENLREEVKKCMSEKAEQGTYPARAPRLSQQSHDTYH